MPLQCCALQGAEKGEGFEVTKFGDGRVALIGGWCWQLVWAGHWWVVLAGGVGRSGGLAALAASHIPAMSTKKTAAAPLSGARPLALCPWQAARALLSEQAGMERKGSAEARLSPSNMIA